jgi:hypothetical protein
MPAERFRQHAQLAGYRLGVTIPLAFPAGQLDGRALILSHSGHPHILSSTRTGKADDNAEACLNTEESPAENAGQSSA